MAVRVKKGNRVLRVSETVLKKYLSNGYDQIDDKGNIVKEATGGKSISIKEYNKLKQELEELKEGSGGDEELKKENTALKGKVTKLENKVKELEEALEKANKNKG